MPLEFSNSSIGINSSPPQDVNGENSTENNFNFWSIRGYIDTVKRLENSNKLCSEMSNMISERADVDRIYSQQLTKWATKWTLFLDANSHEYGSARRVWQSFCNEATQMAIIHRDMRDNLLGKILSEIKRWQKETFHKSALPTQSVKEVRNMEQAFEQAQKPWAKRDKILRASRKEYHNACKNLRTLRLLIEAGKSENSSLASGAGGASIGGGGAPANTLTADQQRKLDDKLVKCESELIRTRAEYEAALKSLENDSGRYIEEMARVFESAQVMEKERIDFLRDIYYKLHETLDISQNISVPQIYNEFHQSIDDINAVEDLEWWDRNYGPHQQLICPKFEEFDPERIASASASKKKLRSSIAAVRNGSICEINTGVSHGNDGAVLTGVTGTPEGPEDGRSRLSKGLANSSKLSRVVSCVNPVVNAASVNGGINAASPTTSPPINGASPLYASVRQTSSTVSSQQQQPNCPYAVVAKNHKTPKGNPFDEDAVTPTAVNQSVIGWNLAAITTNNTTTAASSESLDQPGVGIESRMDKPNAAPSLEDLSRYSGGEPIYSNLSTSLEDIIITTSSSTSSNHPSHHLVVSPQPPPPPPPPPPQCGRPAQPPLPPTTTTIISGSSGGGQSASMTSSLGAVEPLQDDGRAGERVRALYDYVGQEDDELSFLAGDVFEKLDERDEQGWCKGRKDGLVGLYPAEYAVLI